MYNAEIDLAVISRDDMTVVETLFRTIKLRDLITAGHSAIMAYYNYMIAKEFDSNNASWYYVGGLLHDIGKIGMSDSILKSSEKLKDEWYKVKTHVLNGVAILEASNLPKIVVDICRYHHEKYDGSGYCEGLSGEDIPLCGRIAIIADVYSTLVGGRRHIDPIDPEKVLTILESEDRFFDPKILPWFISEMRYRLNTGQEPPVIPAKIDWQLISI